MNENNQSIKTLQLLFAQSADIQFQPYYFHGQCVHFILCEGMVDLLALQEVVVPRVDALYNQSPAQPAEKLHLPGLQQVTTKEMAISLVYKGHLLLFFEAENKVFACNIAKRPNRSPEETSIEVSIKGPRDNFIEDLTTNIALIRKRLPTNSLCVEKLQVGRRSKTDIALLYMDDIADAQILNELKNTLEKIDTDIVGSGDALMEYINKGTILIPRSNYTGRPDFAVDSLVVGRYVILMDGIAYAMITPVNLLMLIKSSEDSEYLSGYASFERILRLVSILIGVLLPAFWLALTTFHQNQLPFQLLATVVQANTGLPLPSALEMLVMIFMFELFREAGTRLPAVVGGTFSVVGGIIIGDAAIRAGVTSPAMIVVIAISTIATFTLVNQSLLTAVSMLRIAFVIVTSILGLFGFFLMLYFTILYIANIRTFHRPLITTDNLLSWDALKKAFFRPPATSYKKRPPNLKSKDKTRGNRNE